MNFTSYVDNATSTKANWGENGASEVYLYIPIESESLKIASGSNEENKEISYTSEDGFELN